MARNLIMIDIRSIDGELLLSVPITQSCERIEELMKSDYVQLSWSSDENIVIPVGSYIEYKGEKFSLLEPYTPEQKDELEFEYRPQFQSNIMIWGKTPFFLYTQTENGISKETDWVLTNNPVNFISYVTDSIYRELGEQWNFSISSDLSASSTISFSTIDIYSALNAIASEFETEWWVDKVNRTIHLGKCQHGEAIVLEVGVNVKPPSVTKNNEGYFTRFYAFGSTRNIEQDYGGANANNIVNKRLTLDPTKYPGGYKDVREGLKDGEIFSKVLIFDDVYPSSKLSIKNVRVRLLYRLDENNNKIQVGTDSNGNPIYDQYAIWYFQIPEFTFNQEDIINGLTPSVNFKSGALAGREFEIIFHDKDKTITTIDGEPFNVLAGDYEICFIEEGTYIIPSVTGLTPSDGDEIVLFNIKMPEEYKQTAYNELEEELDKEIERINSNLNTYQIQSDAVSFYNNNPNLSLGQNVRYINRFYSYETRVMKLVTKLDYECEQTITIGNKKIKGNTEQLKEDVVNANTNINLLAILNETTNSLTQAYQRTQKLMMDGFASIKDMWMFDDNDPNTIYSKFNVYSLGAVSARGKNTSGSGGGGGGLIQSVYGYNSFGGSFSDSNLTDTFNAYAINRLYERIKTLEDSGLDESELAAYLTANNYAKKNDIPTIPTNVSAFYNDAGYVNSDDVSALIKNGFVSLWATEMGKWFAVDEETGAIYPVGGRGFFSESFVSARGKNSSGSSGGGLVQTVYGYNDLSKTFSDATLNDTFNAYTISRLASRITTLENKTITEVSWGIVTGKPSWLTDSVPSVSTFANDANYATVSDVDSRINALIDGAPAAYDTLKEIADVLAGNVNSIGDIITTLGTKADKATTLSGYGITDAYTMAQVNDLLSKKVNTTDYATLWQTEMSKWFAIDEATGGIYPVGDRGFFSNSFISARGANDSSSSGGSTTLEGLLDVTLSSPVSGQSLVYDGSKWVNKLIEGGIGELTSSAIVSALGYTPVAPTDLSGYATVSALSNKVDFIGQVNNPDTHTSTSLGYTGSTNAPDGRGGGAVYTSIAANNYGGQIYLSMYDGSLYTRYRRNGVWGSWVTNLNDKNGVLKYPDAYYYDLNTLLGSGNAVIAPYFQRVGSTEDVNNVGSARKGVIRMYGGGSESQLVFDHYNGAIYYRNYQSSVFSGWRTLITSSNYTDYIYSPSTIHSLLNGYLPLKGGTIEADFGALIIKRSNQYASAIGYSNSNGVLGYIGYNDDYVPKIWDKDKANPHIILHSGNFNKYGVLGTNTGDVKQDKYTWVTQHPSFVGSLYDSDGVWQNIISIRHRNGEDDGNKYGLLFYSPLTYDSSIYYRKHFANNWGTVCEILDSRNYANYALPLSGGTLTGAIALPGERYTGNYGIDMSNSDIINVNAIFTSDKAENALEGIQFKRSNGNFDSIWASDGTFYFSPDGSNANRNGSYSTNYTVWHSGNDGAGSGLDADTLDGYNSYDFRPMISLGGNPDYAKAVIALHPLDNSYAGAEFYSFGTIYTWRVNGLYPPMKVEYSSQKAYNSAIAYIDVLQSAGSCFKTCTFTYNGVKYAGLTVHVDSAAQVKDIRITGHWTHTPFKIIYRTNSGVSNSEVANSLVVNGSDILSYGFYNGNGTEIAYTTSNVASATKLQTARTIWGQSFDGTGNISGAMTNVLYISNSDYYVGDRNSGLGTSDGGLLLYTYGAKPMSFYINGVEAMKITSAHNVGIGTTSPEYKLDVQNDNDWVTRFLSPNSVVYASHRSGYGLYVGSKAASSNFYLFSVNYGQTYLGSAGNSAFYVRGDGNVGIGTESPIAKLHINGAAYVGDYLFVGANAGKGNANRAELHVISSGDTPMDIVLGSSSQKYWSITARNWSESGTGKSFALYNNVLGVYAFRVLNNTNNTEFYGGISSASYITAKSSSSDIRLKTDLTDYDAMDLIRSKRSVMYHWNDVAKVNSEIFNTDAWQFGLIAQEVEETHPQLVSNVFGDYLTINYERLIPILWRGVQELDIHLSEHDREIMLLKEENKMLRDRINELERRVA